ncbi:hypothetical protein ACEUZ9_005484 [Paracoccus litorisediminis]
MTDLEKRLTPDAEALLERALKEEARDILPVVDMSAHGRLCRWQPRIFPH